MSEFASAIEPKKSVAPMEIGAGSGTAAAVFTTAKVQWSPVRTCLLVNSGTKRQFSVQSSQDVLVLQL